MEEYANFTREALKDLKTRENLKQPENKVLNEVSMEKTLISLNGTETSNALYNKYAINQDNEMDSLEFNPRTRFSDFEEYKGYAHATFRHQYDNHGSDYSNSNFHIFVNPNTERVYVMEEHYDGPNIGFTIQDRTTIKNLLPEKEVNKDLDISTIPDDIKEGFESYTKSKVVKSFDADHGEKGNFHVLISYKDSEKNPYSVAAIGTKNESVQIKNGFPDQEKALSFADQFRTPEKDHNMPIPSYDMEI